MSVVHVISGRFYGGGQRFVLDLLKVADRSNGSEWRLWALGDPLGTPLAGRCNELVEYDGRYNSPRVLVSTARRLRKVIHQENVDILHTHGLDADLIGALAVCGIAVHHVCHLHISPPANRGESRKAAVRRMLFGYLMRWNGSWFVAVSDAVRREMIRYYDLPADRVITVRNGIDLKEFDSAADMNGRPTDRVVFGTAARLAPMKGLEYLIQAAAQLRERGVEFELRIAGTGGQRKALEELVESLDLKEQVRLVGQISDMPAFYRDLAVFVLPSVSTEGLPLVVLEAMAMRLPVVATDVGGTAEALRDGIDGILVQPGDVDSLAAALAELAGDPHRRELMGETGSARVRSEFSIERVAEEIRQVYARVLAEN